MYDTIFYCDKNFTNGTKPITFCPLCKVCRKTYMIDYYLQQVEKNREEERILKLYAQAAANAKRDYFIIPLPPKPINKQITIFD